MQYFEIKFDPLQNNFKPDQTKLYLNKKKSNLAPSLKRPKTSATKLIKERSKPYAPVYSSLLRTEEITASDKTSITRQLCALLWILESMSAEPPNYIGPLRTCFLIK